MAEIFMREKLTSVLIEIMTKPLPENVTEMDRVCRMAFIRTMWTIDAGDSDFTLWDIIWADVMKATGCGTWEQTMNKVKH